MNSTRIMYLCTKVYMCVWVVAMGKQIQTLNWQQWKKELSRLSWTNARDKKMNNKQQLNHREI